MLQQTCREGIVVPILQMTKQRGSKKLSDLPKVLPLDLNPGPSASQNHDPFYCTSWPFLSYCHGTRKGRERPEEGGGRDGACFPPALPCLVSETRLVEVLEGVCSKSDFECHRLLELSEELVESWWFHK